MNLILYPHPTDKSDFVAIKIDAITDGLWRWQAGDYPRTVKFYIIEDLSHEDYIIETLKGALIFNISNQYNLCHVDCQVRLTVSPVRFISIKEKYKSERDLNWHHTNKS